MIIKIWNFGDKPLWNMCIFFETTLVILWRIFHKLTPGVDQSIDDWQPRRRCFIVSSPMWFTIQGRHYDIIRPIYNRHYIAIPTFFFAFDFFDYRLQDFRHRCRRILSDGIKMKTFLKRKHGLKISFLIIDSQRKLYILFISVLLLLFVEGNST